MGRKKTTGKTPQSTFRLTAQNLADLDAIAAKLSDQLGSKQTRADAIRFGVRLALTHFSISPAELAPPPVAEPVAPPKPKKAKPPAGK